MRFRRGWMLGDGAGKGRQVASVLLDNWLKGRRRAPWVSKSDKLVEDAQRDWSGAGAGAAARHAALALSARDADPPRTRHPLHHLRGAAGRGATPAAAGDPGAAIAAGIGGFALGALAGGAARPAPPPPYYGAPAYYPAPVYEAPPPYRCWRERRPVFDEYGVVIGHRPSRVCE